MNYLSLREKNNSFIKLLNIFNAVLISLLMVINNIILDSPLSLLFNSEDVGVYCSWFCHESVYKTALISP